MSRVDQTDAFSLLARAAGGDGDAWGALLAQHQQRLQGVASFRLDPRLRGRVDAADVVQEAFITATARRADFFGQSAQPLRPWLGAAPVSQNAADKPALQLRSFVQMEGGGYFFAPSIAELAKL